MPPVRYPLRNSPALLEIYKKGFEVLIVDDDIDEIVFSRIDNSLLDQLATVIEQN